MQSSPVAKRRKRPNFSLEFKLKLVELSYLPECSVAQVAREHEINDNLLFRWRQQWREGTLCPPGTALPALIPVAIDDGASGHEPLAHPLPPADDNISCEVVFRHGTLRLSGNINSAFLNLLIQALKR